MSPASNSNPVSQLICRKNAFCNSPFYYNDFDKQFHNYIHINIIITKIN